MAPCEDRPDLDYPSKCVGETMPKVRGSISDLYKKISSIEDKLFVAEPQKELEVDIDMEVIESIIRMIQNAVQRLEKIDNTLNKL